QYTADTLPDRRIAGIERLEEPTVHFQPEASPIPEAVTTHKSEGKRRIASSAEPVGGQLDLPISELEADPPRPNRKLLLSLSVSNGRQQDESDKRSEERRVGKECRYR